MADLDDLWSSASEPEEVVEQELSSAEDELRDHRLPLPTKMVYDSRDQLELETQLFARPHGYTITRKRTRNFKNGRYVGTPYSIELQCDRSAEIRPSTAQWRERSASRAGECPFELRAKRNPITNQ